MFPGSVSRPVPAAPAAGTLVQPALAREPAPEAATLPTMVVTAPRVTGTPFLPSEAEAATHQAEPFEPGNGRFVHADLQHRFRRTQGNAFMRKFMLALTAAALPALPAVAHVTVDPAQAAPHAYVRAALRVGHGCGTAATTRLTVRMPEGVTGARPMPKPGWTLVITPREEAAAPGAHGSAPEVATITWEGGRLPNEHYDEFVLRFRAPNEPGATLWFAVRQECEGGAVTDWSEIPADGRRISDYPHPAASMRLIAR